MGLFGSKADKLAKRFCELVAENDADQAVEFYETKIAECADEVSRRLRTAFHVLHWMATRSPDDMAKIRLLAAQDSSSGAPAALASLSWLDEVESATRALRECTQIPKIRMLGAQEHPIIRLARAVSASFAATRKTRPPKEVAGDVLLLLPASKDLSDPGLQRIHRQLDLWASFTLGEHAHCLDLLAQPDWSADFADGLRLTVLLRWGQQEMSQGHASETLELLAKAQRYSKGPQVLGLVHQWAVAALNGGHGDALAELLPKAIEITTELCAGEPLVELRLALAAALLRKRSLVAGREQLDAVLAKVERPGQPPSPLGTRALFLRAVSLLASSSEWPAVAAGGTAQADSVIMRNRATWATLGPQIEACAAQLVARSATGSHVGHALVGLLMYLDRSRAPTAPQLQGLAQAAGELAGWGPVDRLERVRTELQNRARATETATELLDAGNMEQLKAFYHQVLGRMTGGIPAILRAAVVMALWDAGHLADPLPELQALAASPEATQLVGRCIEQVELRRCLRALAEACQGRGEAPALTPLQRQPELRALGAMATGLNLLRRGSPKPLLTLLADLDSNDPAVAYLRFRAAWAAEDTTALRASMERALASPWLAKQAQARNATLLRVLGLALASEQVGVVLACLRELKLEPSGILSLAAQLADAGQHALAARLVALHRNEVTAPELIVTDQFVEAILAAREDRLTVAISAFDQVLEAAAGNAEVLGGRDLTAKAVSVAHLLRALAELALTARTGANAAAHWETTRRTVEQHARAVGVTPILEAQGRLVTGLVAYLSTDVMVDDQMLAHLLGAQRILPLQRKAAFIERLVGDLGWRKRVLDTFWLALANGAFEDAHDAYHRQIAPAFGRRIPAAIELAMVLVDWSLSSLPSAEALRKMQNLEEAHAELSKRVLSTIRDQIQNGETTRELTRLIQVKDHEAVIALIQRTAWAGFEPGAMPVPVAIALLHALYKKQKLTEALNLGLNIERHGNIATWVKDLGSLIVGYIRFEQSDFEAAASSFEKVSVPRLLEHDVDRYWAASHFSLGLQLLKVDQKEKAFDAFARSIAKRGAAGNASNLAPLFVHFALKNIEARSGTRALQSFELLEQSLAGAPPNAAVVKNGFVARLGKLICECLTEGKRDAALSEGFLEVLPDLESAREKLGADAHKIERSLRLAAACEVLRHARRSETPPAGKRFLEALRTQSKAVRALDDQSHRTDPVLLLLEGLIELRLASPPNVDQAIEMLTQAFNLGAQSQRLTQLLQEHREVKKKLAESSRAALAMFDVYLASGEIPEAVKDAVARHDNVAELYRLHRGKQPRRLAIPQVASGVATLAERLKGLSEFIVEFKDNASLRKLKGELDENIARLRQIEESMGTCESSIMVEVARVLREQSLATP